MRSALTTLYLFSECVLENCDTDFTSLLRISQSGVHDVALYNVRLPITRHKLFEMEDFISFFAQGNVRLPKI